MTTLRTYLHLQIGSSLTRLRIFKARKGTYPSFGWFPKPAEFPCGRRQDQKAGIPHSEVAPAFVASFFFWTNGNSAPKDTGNCSANSPPNQARFRLQQTDPFSLATDPGFGRAHQGKKKREGTRHNQSLFFNHPPKRDCRPCLLKPLHPPTNSFPLSTHTTTPHPLFHQSINPHRNLLRFIPSTPIK